jgi:hypothetical protein
LFFKVLPYIQLSFGIAIVLTFVAMVFFWQKVPQWIWVVVATIAQCSGLILPTLISVMASEVILLSISAGLIGLSSAIYNSSMSGYTSELFPHEPSSAFALLKIVDCITLAVTVLVIHFASFYFAVGVTILGALVSCASLLYTNFVFLQNFKKNETLRCDNCNEILKTEEMCELNTYRLHSGCLTAFRRKKIFCGQCGAYLDARPLVLNGIFLHEECLASYRKETFQSNAFIYIL